MMVRLNFEEKGMSLCVTGGHDDYQGIKCVLSLGVINVYIAATWPNQQSY